MRRAGLDFNVLISRVLRYGVLISTTIILIGILMILAGDRASGFPSSLESLLSFNYGRPTLNGWNLAEGIASLNPIYVIQLGILIMLATPIARVVLSIFLFSAEKDLVYIGLTVFVLIVLLLSIFVVGPIVAA